MDSNSRAGKRETSGRGRKEWIRAVILIVLAILMVLAAVLTVLYRRWVQKPELPGGDSPVESGQVLPSGQDLGIDSVQPKVSGERKSEDFYTILVFGPDETSGLTDVMMLVSYDVTNQNATVMSFPRDTLINSSGRTVSQKQLNAVYNRYGQGQAGIEGLKSEISELVGFLPDYYIMIDWHLVGEMVGAIGGVWFDIPYNMQYDDPYQDLHIHFEPGNTFLNGEDAMKVIRWRENNSGIPSGGDGSDTMRINLRNDFLKAVLGQVLQLKNVTKIGELASLFSQRVTSDLTIENLFWFGSQAVLGGLRVEDVNFVTMPYYGASNNRNAVYWGRVYPNQQALLELINESLNPFVDEVTLNELDLISVSADGNTLSSTTGVLADPSAGYYVPPSVSQAPDPSPSPSQGQETEPLPSPSQGLEPSASPEPSQPLEPTEQPQPPTAAPSPDPSPSQSPDQAQQGTQDRSGEETTPTS